MRTRALHGVRVDKRVVKRLQEVLKICFWKLTASPAKEWTLRHLRFISWFNYYKLERGRVVCHLYRRHLLMRMTYDIGSIHLSHAVNFGNRMKTNCVIPTKPFLDRPVPYLIPQKLLEPASLQILTKNWCRVMLLAKQQSGKLGTSASRHTNLFLNPLIGCASSSNSDSSTSF